MSKIISTSFSHMRKTTFLTSKKRGQSGPNWGMSVMFLAIATIELVALTVAVLTKLNFTPVRNQA